MPNPGPRKLSPAERAALNAAANEILPLTRWVGEPGKYDPTPAKRRQMPWRRTGSSAAKLSVENLGFVDAFEAWLDEDDCFLDHYDVERFLQETAASLVTSPLKNCPLGERVMRQRRAEWGLLDPMFDGSIGANVEFTTKSKEAGHGLVNSKPLTRRTFYDACLTQFMAAVALRQPGSSLEWRHLIADLAADNNVEKQVANKTSAPITGWNEQAIEIKSSAFMVALTRDILRHCLSFGTTAPNSSASDDEKKLWAQALPLELAEQRRRGNAYEGFDAEKATEQFVKKLDSVQAALRK